MAKQTALHEIPVFKNQLKALRECEIMVQYAQSNSKSIPWHVLKQLNDLQAIEHDLKQQLKTTSVEEIDPLSLNMALIGDIHGSLAQIIAPASPESVLLLEKHKRKGLFGILGPVPLVRRLNVITILCLVAFLSLFFAEGPYEVNSYTVNGDILSYNGWKFVLNELAIVCIAALGASFYALFEVHKYITNKSYDPKYDSIYWIRFVLGIVSGVILAQFIFVSPEILGADTSEVEEAMRKSRELGGFMTYKPLLAFLGGFSARVVHKILNSMVDAIETFISGSARDMVAAREQVARARIDEQVKAVRRTAAQKASADRMKATMQLMALKEELNYGANADDINFRLTELMEDFMKPVGGVDIDFNKFKNVGHKVNDDLPPVVEPAFELEREDDFTDPIVNDKGEEVNVNDVDELDIPDFPDDMDNPDFPMPGDLDAPENQPPTPPNDKK